MRESSAGIPPLPPVAGAAASDGSPRSGYVPAAGSSPMGAAIGTSPGAGRPAALEIGAASAGSRPAGGVVRPGARPVGLVSAGLVSAGVVNAVSVRPGPVAVSGDRLALGAVRPG